MRKLLCLPVLFFILACNSESKEPVRILADSNGNINNLQVVITDVLWNGNVGENIRDIFAAPVDGLPQEEPLFNISQIPPKAFSGFARNNRIFLHVQQADTTYVKYGKEPFASPQTGVFISGPNAEAINEQLTQNSAKIIYALRAAEIQEKQRRINKSLLDLTDLQNDLGISLEVPTAYRVAKKQDDFYWIRKDIRSGTLNIIAYQVDLDAIGSEDIIQDIITLRDSIGGDNVTVDEGGRFITEEAYAPYLFEVEIDGKFTYETKGTWEVKDKWMAGPFLNYAIKDPENNRYLIIEGFTFAPSIAKRDYQFELEAIIKSIKLL